MGCKITTEILRGCRSNVGGIKKVYIANFDDMVSVTPVVSDDLTDTGMITAISMAGSPAAGFYRYEFTKDSSSYTQTFSQDIASETGGWVQSLNLIFAKNEASKRNAVKMLGQNSTLIIVEDKNNKFWLLGEENGCELTAAEAGSGVLQTDRNGYSVTFEGRERFAAREIFVTDYATTAALVESYLAV